ncbi:methylated-DNA--[protein]-cysteine S-methyltransferase [Gilliamella sp. Pas-s95]|uniref:methylated-DNA--[protein]-cysteine S-methyltransferase n=1 Tax=Gilliamella sp. Pas-s95 TaxID=2687317 RepID=UPI0013236267|nr:methylated-DNA--[protein]-cysteine S-methyltransferase [Gilliamella sp. Pas-s95]MWN04780.1 methylated-DNA--[protein]-cysteine S-methyltransferase [Gilliamella sp. Pas-s95]
MHKQKQIDFDRIKKAIGYLNENYKSQPTLEQVAEHVNLSSYHFQRMFSNWAGVSPKQFLRYISITHAKNLLKEENASLLDTTYELGLSSTSRLHDLFIDIEGMTPGEYKNGGENLSINYSFVESPFGETIVASTTKGICYIAFVKDEKSALQSLKKLYPNAQYRQYTDQIQQNATFVFTQDWSKLDKIKLHIKGTDFQLKVWQALLTIPMGKLSTYSNIAHKINNPKASRAVGWAIGDNPVAFLIPCHRVIKSTGLLGQYHWGSDRKAAIIGWEGAKIWDQTP